MSEAVNKLGPSEVPGTVDWWRRRYDRGLRRRPRDDGLSIERITTAALAITDTEGLEALTMRRLAGDLHAGVASLYRHVANRDELLVEMMDHILGEIVPPPPDGSWRERASWLAHEFRRVMLAHRGIIPMLANDRLLGPNAMRGRELSLRGLLDRGFSPEQATGIYGMVVSWVLGYTMISNNVERQMDEGTPTRARSYETVERDLYPTVRQLADAGYHPGDDAVFDLGLVTILDGIEARFRP